MGAHCCHHCALVHHARRHRGSGLCRRFWRATQSFHDELHFMTAAHPTAVLHVYQHANCTLMATRVQLHLAKWISTAASQTMNTEERPISPLFCQHGAR
jgi:hypothetical protein